MGDPNNIYSEIVEVMDWGISTYNITEIDNLGEYISPIGNHTKILFYVKTRVYFSEEWTYTVSSSCSTTPPPPFILGIDVDLLDPSLDSSIEYNYIELVGYYTVCDMVAIVTFPKDTINEYSAIISFLIINHTLSELPDGNYEFIYNVGQADGNAGYAWLEVFDEHTEFSYEDIITTNPPELSYEDIITTSPPVEENTSESTIDRSNEEVLPFIFPFVMIPLTLILKKYLIVLARKL